MDLSTFVSLGLIGAASFYSIIGILGATENIKYGYFIFLMILNGACQSTSWPGLVTTMGNWFGKNSRGFLLGMWGGNTNAGDILGVYIAAFAITYKNWGWPYAVIIASAFQFGMGAIVKLFLTPYPEKIGFTIQESTENSKVHLESINSIEKEESE